MSVNKKSARCGLFVLFRASALVNTIQSGYRGAVPSMIGREKEDVFYNSGGVASNGITSSLRSSVITHRVASKASVKSPRSGKI